MISKWSELPTEIFQKVFKDENCLTNKLACMLVCKNWCQQAIPLVYSTVRIRSFEQHSRFTESIKSSGHGAFVKHLHFDTYENKNVAGASFYYASMYDHLPNLKTLGRFHNFCYLYLLDAIVDGKLEQLQDIPFPFENRECNDYASCVSHLRNQIKSLAI